MFFAVDIGNTNIVLAVHDGEKWAQTFRVYSDQAKTGDEYFVILDSLFTHAGCRRTTSSEPPFPVWSRIFPALCRRTSKDCSMSTH